MTTHYFICSLPRSGSTLLGQGLQDTFLAGRPVEYFNRGYVGGSLQRPGTTIFQYLNAAKRAGTTENNVFGAKVHWFQLSEFLVHFTTIPGWNRLLLPQLISRLFPNDRYIWLRRTDRLRQAVSLYKALRLNIWWRTSGTQQNKSATHLPFSHPLARQQVRSAYLGGGDRLRLNAGNGQSNSAPLSSIDADIRMIERLESILAAQDACWAQFFEESDIQPLVLTYEDLCTAYEPMIVAVLDYLGISKREGLTIPTPRLAKQSDANSEELIQLCLTHRRGVQLIPIKTPPAASPTRLTLSYGDANSADITRYEQPQRSLVFQASYFSSQSDCRADVRPGAPRQPLCVALRDFLLEDELAALMAYTLGRACDFVRDGNSPLGAQNHDGQRSLVLMDLAGHREVLYRRIQSYLPSVLNLLGHSRFTVLQAEMMITATEGGFAKPPGDKVNLASHSARLAFSYCFYRHPKPFEGGALRIYRHGPGHGFSDKGQGNITLASCRNQIVFFPSCVAHQVLPVRSVSRSFADSRFAVEGSIYERDSDIGND